ncbi:MAG: (d)CMP kinase [Nitrospiraceae bacterium]
MQHQGKRRLIITIDGPAGAGKSTVAKRLASHLGYLYLDTGALYRAVALQVRATGVNPADEQAVSAVLPSTRISMEQHADRLQVRVNDRDVTQKIRTPQISEIASTISAIPAVREWLFPVQRELAAEGGVVAEGRDAGTRVFPGADVKFFLDADLAVRARRRQQELTAAGHAVKLQQTMDDICARDARDRGRDLAPLVPASDALVIDTSTLQIDQVVERMMGAISTKL